jgi:Fic-DOC domain mobile mystery protein B
MHEPVGGTILDPDEKDGLLFRHIDTRVELDQMEQINIQQGMLWLLRKRVTAEDLLCESFVRQLHRKLFGQVWKWAGSYRLTEKNIGIAPEQVVVQLRLLMDDTRFWIINSVFKPQELALRFHHRLVYIHPFPNGNGRLSRIMADAILTKILAENPIKWGEKSINSEGSIRSNYINALRRADKSDYSVLLRLYGVSTE